jgi:hypothetical protein
MNAQPFVSRWNRLLEPVTSDQRPFGAARARSKSQGEDLNAWENEGGSLYFNRPSRVMTKERLLAGLGAMLILGALLFAFANALG